MTAVLSIFIHDSHRQFCLRLRGQLAGAWVRELELCWRTGSSTVGDRPVVVDLRGVDFVDGPGQELLDTMRRAGVRVMA
jgi:hypothetical protein